MKEKQRSKIEVKEKLKYVAHGHEKINKKILEMRTT